MKSFLLKLKKITTQKQGNSHQVKGEITYFQMARSWSDDFYAATLASLNRWRAATLYVLTPLSLLLLICVVMLIPAQHIQPLLVNHYENGLVTVAPVSQKQTPINRAQVESDIVRYIINRESYSPMSYNEQFSLVNLLSSRDVAKQYNEIQNVSNKQSPINSLGNKGFRTVHVQGPIVFINRATDRNLAEVNITVTDHQKLMGTSTTTPYTILLSWNYRGTPENPDEMWRNWDGFAVTSYRVDQRSTQ